MSAGHLAHWPPPPLPLENVPLPYETSDHPPAMHVYQLCVGYKRPDPNYYGTRAPDLASTPPSNCSLVAFTATTSSGSLDPPQLKCHRTMKVAALLLALLAAPLGLGSLSGDSFDPTIAPLSELVPRNEPARPEPRSTSPKQATRASVVDRLGKRRAHGGRRRSAASQGAGTCTINPAGLSTDGTPNYAIVRMISASITEVSPTLGNVGW